MRAFCVPQGAPQRLLEELGPSETGTQSTVRDKFDPLGVHCVFMLLFACFEGQVCAHVFVPAAHWWLSGNVKLGLIWGSVVHCDVFVLVCCAFCMLGTGGISGNLKLGLIWGSVVHCDVFVLVCCAFCMLGNGI